MAFIFTFSHSWDQFDNKINIWRVCILPGEEGAVYVLRQLYTVPRRHSGMSSLSLTSERKNCLNPLCTRLWVVRPSWQKNKTVEQCNSALMSNYASSPVPPLYWFEDSITDYLCKLINLLQSRLHHGPPQRAATSYTCMWQELASRIPPSRFSQMPKKCVHAIVC